MNYALSIIVFSMALASTACSQTAGGDIRTDTNISPTTNFQLNSENGQQRVEVGGSADSQNTDKGE